MADKRRNKGSGSKSAATRKKNALGLISTALVITISAMVLYVRISGAEENGGEPVDRQAAINMIVDIISRGSLQGHVMAFLVEEPLQKGQVVEPFLDGKERIITSPTWFGWINDDADALFAHDTRYVFIDVESGAVDVVTEEWWPVLDGNTIFMSRPDKADEAVLIYSTFHPEDLENEGGGQ